VSPRPWFRARESGLGWTPITWEGWLLTLVPMFLVLAANLFLVTHLLAHRR
jgi:hypothetical protein